MPLLVLSEEDVSTASSALTPDELMVLMALVFEHLNCQLRCIQLPLRTSITTNKHTTLFMPARIDQFGTTIKTVSVPTTGERGIHATTLVLDQQSGAVKAVINATSLTALRTAAGSALATRLLGPSDPKVLVAFGAGRQIEAHVDLLIRVFPSLDRCTIVNRSLNTRLETLLAKLRSRFPHVTFSSEELESENLENVVSEADIICTATSSTKPLFKSHWVKKGTHINLVGSYKPSMIEVDTDLIKRTGKVLVDSKEACSVEAGELIKAGLTLDDLVEVGAIVEHDGKPIKGTAQMVRCFGDVTIFKSVGVGLQDTAVAVAVLNKAVEMGLGTEVTQY
ncbi:NAD-binding protein [Fomitiporia mediterranea MF3/22]|uniref:NAD-binding protein n=1 Tax=Fomitiporia mediterranea (strain MF3/22) TaxID=694068 RepID=UPI0004409623|nr:NAD-binding protein [Fomitiporia mediterranea MF3/22]EJC97959.1 NAD-binding protein [Fomitiporia mediterranea MF3/22]